MRVIERGWGDIAELERLARLEQKAIRRDRYRAVLLALEGQEAVEIARAIGRSAGVCRTGFMPIGTAG